MAKKDQETVHFDDIVTEDVETIDPPTPTDNNGQKATRTTNPNVKVARAALSHSGYALLQSIEERTGLERGELIEIMVLMYDNTPLEMRKQAYRQVQENRSQNIQF